MYGAYAKWLVANSGRKEAFDSLAKVVKVQGELKKLDSIESEVSSIKSLISTLHNKIDKVKK